jgi:integrase
MATVNFLYRSVKLQAPLIVRFLFRNANSKDIVLSAKTKLEVTKEYWTEKNNRKADGIIKNQKIQFDQELLKIETHLLTAFNSDLSKSDIEKDWLTRQLDKYYNPKQLLTESFYLNYWIQNIIDNASTVRNGKGSVGLSTNTIKGYKDLKNVIKRYNGLEPLKVLSIDKDWINHFFEWLKINEKYAYNTAVKKVSILKAVITKASSLIETADLKTISIKSVSTYEDDTDVITLSFSELEQIKNCKLTSEALINARKWLLLACFTGQRGEALTNRVIEENFKPYKKGYKIEIKQIKGSKKVTIPVLPITLEIYENGLPYRVSTQKLNIHFKEVCRIAGINTPITGKIKDKETNRNIKGIRPKHEYISTHIGRRSFASNHFDKMPHQSIMKVTGHSKYSTFLKYVQKDSDDHLDTFNDYYKLLEEQKKSEKQTAPLKIVKRG